MAPSFPKSGAQDQHPYPPSLPYNNSSTNFNKPDPRLISRTPSPTPSEEAELLRDSLFDWKAFLDWRYWFRREWLWYYVIGGVILILSILIAVYDTTIVKWLTPATNWMHSLKFGWLIPVAILFVISFPPLFGHEIIAILCGVVWGLWVGFAIVALGSYLGELGNFYAFKYCCRSRGEKLEKENINYACLAQVVRNGGVFVATICRLSVLPGHFTTAIFSTCGMNVIVFSIACILSMPKQLITVYIGVILEESGTGAQTTRDKLISDLVLVVTIAVTVTAMWYLQRKIKAVKPDIIYARRKARQAKMDRAAFTPYSVSNNSTNSVIFNPQGSETNIPLNSSTLPYGATGAHQRWDKEGHAVGYAGDPRLYVPEPQRPQDHTLAYQTEGGNGIGTSYPQNNEVAGGRSPVRQESGDSVEWNGEGRQETLDIPRILSPVNEPLNDPWEPTRTNPQQSSYSAPLSPPPSSSSPRVAQTPTQAQYAISNRQLGISTDITSPPLYNPYAATPTQFNHPQVPISGSVAGTTNVSLEGHSQPVTEEKLQGAGPLSSPPSGHATIPPRQ